jgi:4,5-DOPA dioxygenase extradiol
VGFADRLETIYDFWGFPEPLYSLNYPATGCREAAEEVVKALSKADFPVKKDDQRGLDHGAWVPLRMMFPDADIPVIPLSIQHQGGPAHYFKVGQALASLANQGFLIIGTGSITHNLRDYQIAVQQGGATPVYVREFADWVADRIASKQTDELINYRQASTHGRQAHPREDHLLPLLVALGAADAQATSERVHAGIDDFVIAMDAYAFWPAH